ncbi:hypothetical protein MK489_08765 [Myxococcota bacterium]|nr:hypothetical protein [Myxococcota bacterium]
MGDRARTEFDACLLALATGIVTTVVFYRFGIDNHVAELPMVLRAMDPNFLPQDFYTNASAGPGPRFRFTQLMAAIASPETLPRVYFALTLLANVAIAGISFTAARNAFAGSSLAGAGAVVLVMSLSPFRLGYAPELYVSQMLSSRLVLPFVLFALTAGLEGRLWRAVVAGGLATWIHPSFGLEGGGLAVALAALGSRRSPAGEGHWARSLAGVGAFGVLALWGLWPSLSDPGIDPAQFIAIETMFRHPQHSLLSLQPPSEGIRAVVFLAASSLALLAWIRLAPPPAPRAVRGGILLWGLSLACVLGALAFELAPEPWLALARPLRGLALVRWWGLVLIGGALGLALQRHASFDRRQRLLSLAALTAAVLGIAASRPSAGAWLCLGTSGSILLLLHGTAHRRPLARIGARVGVCTSAAILLIQLVWLPPGMPESWRNRTERLRPALSLDDHSGDDAEIARWARRHTPVDAVFLTPPDAGWFRLWAERAVVVDFKAFPFQGQAMLEWRRRLDDCFGPTRESGWRAAQELARAYAETPPESRVAGNCRHSASHALIRGDHPTSQPVLATRGRYRIIALP